MVGFEFFSTKIPAMFHGIIVLVVGLTFSVPFAILAQQNTPQAEAKTIAAQNTDAMRVEAKTAAEQDTG